jgi:hypothetical protein
LYVPPPPQPPELDDAAVACHALALPPPDAVIVVIPVPEIIEFEPLEATLPKPAAVPVAPAPTVKVYAVPKLKFSVEDNKPPAPPPPLPMFPELPAAPAPPPASTKYSIGKDTKGHVPAFNACKTVTFFQMPLALEVVGVCAVDDKIEPLYLVAIVVYQEIEPVPAVNLYTL